MNTAVSDWLAWMYGENTRNMARIQRFQKLLVHDAEPAVGLTPKDIIWTKNKSRLYHYFSDKVKYETPLLLTYALINKPYIMDLHPGNSMVEYLVNEGFDVYMLDWGTPGPEDKYLKFDDFILDYLPEAFQTVKRTSGSERVSLLGYCMGGTIASIFAALHPEIGIANLLFLAAPIDFADSGLFTSWLDPKYYNVDKMVDVLGNIPAEVIDFGNKMLKPVNNFYSSYKGLWDNLDKESTVKNWQYMNHWVTDGTPFPGEAYRQWIKEFYQKNALVNKELLIRGRKVDLSAIRCPVLNLIGKKDHIVVPRQAENLHQFLSCEDYQMCMVPSGHVSLVVGKYGKTITWPRIKEFLAQRDQ
ncbi:MAG TPA: class III poly(R)-hydroxyalkanoic acid synthase subunit PhaC [Bacillota bacterium]|nr:class III poly(R)-hydroxyalkanoic acid synthase subunit PhaC [Bacillota bacterium]